MRQRITLLVAATTSAIVLAFVIPLAGITAKYADAKARGDLAIQSKSLAAVVASVRDRPALAQSVDTLARTAGSVDMVIITPDGSVLGARPSPLTEAALARARDRQESFSAEDDTTISVVTPVRKEDGTFVVATSIPRSRLSEGVAGVWFTLLLLASILMLLSLALARSFGRRVAKPVTDLAEVAEALRAGNLQARATPEGTPETRQLGHAFNQLADRIEGLVAEEREAVADLGHRLRTPVTALRLDTDLVTDPVVADRLREHVDHLHRQIDTVVREARRHARDGLPTSCDAAAVVTDRASFWRPLAEDQGRTMHVFGTGVPAPVALPSEDVQEILDTLLDNVFAHTPEGAPIEMRVTPSRSAVALTIADGGPGADPSQIARGTSGGASTGLGLDIVRRLAESAGGQMSLRVSALGGLAVDVVLPLAA